MASVQLVVDGTGSSLILSHQNPDALEAVYPFAIPNTIGNNVLVIPADKQANAVKALEGAGHKVS